MNAIDNFFKVFLSVSLYKGCSALLQLLFTFVVVKFFDANVSAPFFWSVSIAFIISGISKLGFDYSMLKLYSSYDFKTNNTLIKCLNLSFMVSTIISMFVIVGFYVSQSWDVKNCITLLASPFISTCYILSFYFQAKRKYFFQQLGIGVAPYTIIILLVLFTKDTNPSVLFLLAWFLSAMIMLSNIKFKFSDLHYFNFNIRLIKYSVKYWAVSSISIILNWIPITVAGFMLVDAQLEVFSFSLRISLIVTFVLTVFNSIVGRDFVKLYKQKEFLKIRLLYKKVVLVSVSIGLTLILSILLSSNMLFSHLSMPNDLLLVFNLIISFQFFNVVTGPLGMVLNMTGNQITVIKGSLLGVLSFLFFSILFFPYIGFYSIVFSVGFMIFTSNFYGIPKLLTVIGLRDAV